MTWVHHMACPLLRPLLWTWLYLTTFVCALQSPVLRKCYLTSEVAANFIQILQRTPEEILQAPCDFITDSLNNKLKSTLDPVARSSLKQLK